MMNRVFTLAVGLALVLTGLGPLPLIAADRSAESPLAYWAAQEAKDADKNAAVLAAESLEELVELDALPYINEDFLARLSDEKKVEIVEQIKASIDTRRAVEERIDGARAVVLRETTEEISYDPASYEHNSFSEIVEMTLTDGSWEFLNRDYVLALPGARASFEASGASSDAANDTLIQQFQGAIGTDRGPLLMITDVLGGTLHQVGHAPYVKLTPLGCLAEGIHPIATKDLDDMAFDRENPLRPVYAEFVEGGESFPTVRQFSASVSGTLEVTRVEDSRFSARFEFTAANKKDPAETVIVTGTIENLLEPCSEEGG